MIRQTGRSKYGALGMHTGSMLIWALWPIWAAGFGLTEAIWLSLSLGLTLSGITQLIFASWWSPKIFGDKKLRRTVKQTTLKRKSSLLPIIGVIIEDASHLAALRLIDPTVSQAIVGFYPVTYALWLWHSAKDRFSFSRSAFVGMFIACGGAALVVISAAGAEFGGGWYLVAGIALVAVSVAAISTKSQEVALVADVGRHLGWEQGDLKREQSLSIIISGGRNLIAGMPLLVVALILLPEGLPAGFWWGNIIFGAILAPGGFILHRYAILLNGDLGLSSVTSAGALATLGFAQLSGGVLVDNAWLLAGGIICISSGSLLTLINYRPKALKSLHAKSNRR